MYIYFLAHEVTLTSKDVAQQITVSLVEIKRTF